MSRHQRRAEKDGEKDGRLLRYRNKRVLPFGSGGRLGERRVEVVGWEGIGWVVGVGGTMVEADTLATDRQGDDMG